MTTSDPDLDAALVQAHAALHELRAALRELALNCLSDMETDGEDTVTLTVAHVDRLCRLAGLAGIDGAVRELEAGAEPPDR